MKLPDDSPPDARRANLAVGLSPIIVLVVFMLIVTQWIGIESGMTIMGACTVWVVYEMHHYQRALDHYNDAFVESHPMPGSSPTQQTTASTDPLHVPTRHVERRVIDSGRALLPDGHTH